MDLPKIKLYMPVIDELRPVTDEAGKQEWLKRMALCGQPNFKISGDMHLLDTCCGGTGDDCGAGGPT